MKLLLLSSVMFASFLSASAQCVPFPASDFENWITIKDTSITDEPYTYEKPDTTWLSITDLLSLAFTGKALPVVNKSTESHSGTYSMKMAAAAGESGDLFGEILYSERPTKFSGYYKYNGRVGDSLSVAIFPSGDSGSVVLLPPASDWTPFGVDIDYQTSNVPDTFLVLFSLANNGATTINAWLDDLCFGDLPSGVDQTHKKGISIYPNPVNDQLIINLENQKVSSIKIIDATGKIIEELTQNTVSVNVADWPMGLYFLKVQTDNGVEVKRFIKE